MSDNRYRLEGDTRSDEIETGLQARVADALWMLSRQWQVGEFRGEDAASPVQVQYQMETTPVNQFRSFREKSFTPIDPFAPLEAYAEQQPPGDLAGFWRSAEAGMHLLRLLSASNLKALRGWFRQAKPLKPAGRVEPGEGAWANLLVRRACDGEGIYDSRDEIALAARRRLTDKTQQQAFDAAFAAWVNWYTDRFVSQSQFDSWDSERMEYRFEVGTGAVVLEAKEYPGGHLDWYSFDVRVEDTKLATQPQDPKTVLPTPVQFAGMGAQRWWEFEDNTVNFADVSSSAVDFARMITAAFMLTFGDDWHVMPVRVPIGSLAKIVSLRVRDSFGDNTPIDSVAVLDGPERVWRYFELTGDQDEPMLFVPAMALGQLEGRALESVTLIRDDTENLGWGIEKTYEGALERPVERMRQWAMSRPESNQSPEAEGLWDYRLLNPVPPYWIPFVPVRMRESTQIRLRRGRMGEWELLPDEIVGIRGQTLLPSPAAPLLLYEEEVPAGGVEILTSYQFARRESGQSLVWLGRRKRPAGPVTPIVRETDAVHRG